eukprot:jgi/Mesvir1/18523/Mv03589-RA.1
MKKRSKDRVTPTAHLHVPQTSPPSDGVYPPHPRKGVDKPFYFLTQRGEEIAYKRPSRGDGNCFYYSLLLGKALQFGIPITADELAAATRQLRKELRANLRRYLSLGLHGIPTDFTASEIKQIDNDLRGKNYATDDIMRLAAHHTGTDIYNLSVMTVEKPFRHKMIVESEILASGDEPGGRRTRAPPVYILHNGTDHWDALIPSALGGTHTVRDVRLSRQRATGAARATSGIERLDAEIERSRRRIRHIRALRDAAIRQRNALPHGDPRRAAINDMLARAAATLRESMLRLQTLYQRRDALSREARRRPL